MDITLYTTFDQPVPYRTIKIYPVTVKDYFLFNYYTRCFTVNKNIIPDPKIITMSNLEYLYYSAQNEKSEIPYLFMFDRVLSLCLRDEPSFANMEDSLRRYDYENGKPFFTIQGTKFHADDYEKIKDIVCQQNMVDMPDPNMSPEVEKALEEAKKYKDKLSGIIPATIEDYIISLSTVTGWTLDYVYSMPIRKFIISLQRFDSFVHYKIYLAASMSGMVEFKDKSFIKHWLNGTEVRNKYDDVSVEMDDLQKKISMTGE